MFRQLHPNVNIYASTMLIGIELTVKKENASYLK